MRVTLFYIEISIFIFESEIRCLTTSLVIFSIATLVLALRGGDTLKDFSNESLLYSNS